MDYGNENMEVPYKTLDALVSLAEAIEDRTEAEDEALRWGVEALFEYEKWHHPWGGIRDHRRRVV